MATKYPPVEIKHGMRMVGGLELIGKHPDEVPQLANIDQYPGMEVREEKDGSAGTIKYLLVGPWSTRDIDGAFYSPQHR